MHPRRLTKTLVTLATAAALSACEMGRIEDCDGGCHVTHDADVHPDVPTLRPTDVLSLHIDPEASLVLIDETHPHPTVSFNVVGEQRDHHTRHVDAVRFQLDDTSLGHIDPITGVLTASGLGGVGTVRVFTLDGTSLSTQTTVTFSLHRVVLGPGVTDGVSAMFAAASDATDGADALPTIDYPLEGAVMPRNVHGPHVQWTHHHAAAALGDLYRVQLSRAHATIEAYYVNVPGFSDDWDTSAVFSDLAGTEVGTPITMRVSVLSGGLRRVSAPRTFRTIDGVVAGSVYYWSPPRGRLLRVDVDTARLVDFLPNPPGGCIACHAVSRDGRRLIAVNNSGGATSSYDLTADLTGSPPPSRFVYSAAAGNMVGSFNGDGSRIVMAQHGGSALQVIDGNTGAAVGMASPGTGDYPEWSPDSSLIAYSRENNLWTTPMMPGDRVGTTALLHDASTLAGGAVDWHPTFSPDSRWIVFQHGSAAFTAGTGALYAISRDGGTPVRMDHANGGPDQDHSFRPVFSPFNSGGYYWVLFSTSRPYGNAWAGANGNKLIWVAAFRNHPEPGVDPSEVPYYLDGQERSTNLSPYWAPPACRDNGVACSAGGDCCSGTCDADSRGSPMCRSPSGSCRARGASCSENADCCGGLACTDAHICDVPEPG